MPVKIEKDSKRPHDTVRVVYTGSWTISEFLKTIETFVESQGQEIYIQFAIHDYRQQNSPSADLIHRFDLLSIRFEQTQHIVTFLLGQTGIAHVMTKSFFKVYPKFYERHQIIIAETEEIIYAKIEEIMHARHGSNGND